jgi:hypothetical protein
MAKEKMDILRDIKKMLDKDVIYPVPILYVGESEYRCILELEGRSPDEIEKIIADEKQKEYDQNEAFKSLMTLLAKGD